MNELTKPIYHIGDTALLDAYFTDEAGDPAEPDLATLIVEKDGIELLRLDKAALETVPETGLVRYRYVITGADGTGRYSWRLFGSGSVVSSAEEDWFYVNPSVVTNPLSED